MPNESLRKIRQPAKNRENNKAFFEFDLEFIEFCPNFTMHKGRPLAALFARVSGL